jgi:hypothetical protein
LSASRLESGAGGGAICSGSGGKGIDCLAEPRLGAAAPPASAGGWAADRASNGSSMRGEKTGCVGTGWNRGYSGPGKVAEAAVVGESPAGGCP